MQCCYFVICIFTSAKYINVNTSSCEILMIQDVEQSGDHVLSLFKVVFYVLVMHKAREC